MEKFYCKSIDETNLVATKFAQSLSNGDMVFLYGDLGAGKTTFTKAVLKALNVDENVTSPTFTLLNNYYNNNINICHFDLYRLEDIDELEQLGFEEFFYSSDVICLIEWPQIIEKSIAL